MNEYLERIHGIMDEASGNLNRDQYQELMEELHANVTTRLDALDEDEAEDEAED